MAAFVVASALVSMAIPADEKSTVRVTRSRDVFVWQKIVNQPESLSVSFRAALDALRNFVTELRVIYSRIFGRSQVIHMARSGHMNYL